MTWLDNFHLMFYLNIQNRSFTDSFRGHRGRTLFENGLNKKVPHFVLCYPLGYNGVLECNSFSFNLTRWSNTFQQFVGKSLYILNFRRILNPIKHLNLKQITISVKSKRKSLLFSKRHSALFMQSAMPLPQDLTLSWRRSLSYRNYRDLRHERVNKNCSKIYLLKNILVFHCSFKCSVDSNWFICNLPVKETLKVSFSK